MSCCLFMQPTSTGFENRTAPPPPNPDPNPENEWRVLACIEHSKCEARIVEAEVPLGTAQQIQPTEKVAPAGSDGSVSAMTAVGPLTTTFTPPASCIATDPQLYQVWSRTSSSYVAGPLFTADSNCFPKSYNPVPTNYYSPGWCPHGYTIACSTLASTGIETETAAVCCPGNLSYTCLASGNSGQPFVGCTTAWSRAEGVLGVTVVKDGTIDGTTSVTETANAITAYGIQIRFRSSDPTPAPRIGDLGLSAMTQTSPSPSRLPVPAQTSPPLSSLSSSATNDGISTAAIVGIAIGSAVAGLLIAGAISLFFFLRWRRKHRLEKQDTQWPSFTPPPVPPKEPMFSSSSAASLPKKLRHESAAAAWRFELSEEAASPRRPSMAHSKKDLATRSPAFTVSQSYAMSSSLMGTRESLVPAGYDVVELEAPNEAVERDRATPASEANGWADRQPKGATAQMPWI
ncbi:uncharacterized protein C8A04DRAFT_11845 [Dichotomopilus funicola]|uniref:Uncharacterized protein n=1 Tax=Dichotomopilus funicola TaxID=1934379 RepID=A0AAN6V3G1_9PEZI|nr:hypothetical protein C8A04DRAFT_11845 [Dichotomopilus funicola]